MTDTRWGRFVIACLAAQVAVYLLYALDVDVFGVQAHNVDWYLENLKIKKLLPSFVPLYVLGAGFIVRWVIGQTPG